MTNRRGTNLAEACPDLTPRWYAVWCMSNAESMVQRSLETMAIETFLPTFADKTEWSDRTKIVQRPPFRGYLFARCFQDVCGEIARLAGVIQLLPTNFKPVSVDSAEIDNIRKVLASGLPATPCPYITGDEVIIDRGPLAGVKGIVVKTKNGTTVVVKIEMLQRAVKVEVDAADMLKKAA